MPNINNVLSAHGMLGGVGGDSLSKMYNKRPQSIIKTFLVGETTVNPGNLVSLREDGKIIPFVYNMDEIPIGIAIGGPAGPGVACDVCVQGMYYGWANLVTGAEYYPYTATSVLTYPLYTHIGNMHPIGVALGPNSFFFYGTTFSSTEPVILETNATNLVPGKLATVVASGPNPGDPAVFAPITSYAAGSYIAKTFSSNYLGPDYLIMCVEKISDDKVLVITCPYNNLSTFYLQTMGIHPTTGALEPHGNPAVYSISAGSFCACAKIDGNYKNATAYVVLVTYDSNPTYNFTRIAINVDSGIMTIWSNNAVTLDGGSGYSIRDIEGIDSNRFAILGSSGDGLKVSLMYTSGTYFYHGMTVVMMPGKNMDYNGAITHLGGGRLCVTYNWDESGPNICQAAFFYANGNTDLQYKFDYRFADGTPDISAAKVSDTKAVVVYGDGVTARIFGNTSPTASSWETIGELYTNWSYNSRNYQQNKKRIQQMWEGGSYFVVSVSSKTYLALFSVDWDNNAVHWVAFMPTTGWGGFGGGNAGYFIINGSFLVFSYYSSTYDSARGIHIITNYFCTVKLPRVIGVAISSSKILLSGAMKAPNSVTSGVGAVYRNGGDGGAGNLSAANDGSRKPIGSIVGNGIVKYTPYINPNVAMIDKLSTY